MVVVTIVKGVVTARQVEEEFTRIHPKTWRWAARRVVDNMFTVQFPNAQTIGECECFNPISMRNVRAKLKVEPWSGVVGAKAELEQAWFIVRGIPYDKRSVPTLAYVGSLVGATSEVDRNSMHRVDFVRIKIAAKDITKVPEVAKGAILPFLYDFYYETEVEETVPNEKRTIKVGSDKDEVAQPSLKKLRTDVREDGTSNLQIEVFSAKGKHGEVKQMGQQVQEPPQILSNSTSGQPKQDKVSSAPPKLIKSPLDKICEVEDQNFKHKRSEKGDISDALLVTREDRVQGLSGIDINESKEEVPSEEEQGSQSNRHITGLIKCVNLESHKKDVMDVLPESNLLKSVLGKNFIVPETPVNEGGGILKVDGKDGPDADVVAGVRSDKDEMDGSLQAVSVKLHGEGNETGNDKRAGSGYVIPKLSFLDIVYRERGDSPVSHGIGLDSNSTFGPGASGGKVNVVANVGKEGKEWEAQMVCSAKDVLMTKSHEVENVSKEVRNISEAQRIPEARFNKRIQEQMIKSFSIQHVSPSKKGHWKV
jgi:hypothetical protein